jgi:hypothetical protein
MAPPTDQLLSRCKHISLITFVFSDGKSISLCRDLRDVVDANGRVLYRTACVHGDAERRRVLCP